MQEGIATFFHLDKHRFEYDDVVFPMNVLGTDVATGRLLYSVDLELGGGSRGLALRAESADLWHRRVRYINRISMDVLRKQAGIGVEYNVDIQACDVCAVGKRGQQLHPMQAMYDVQRAFQLVTVNTMGPISPEALGGYNYVTKFVDQHTKVEGHLSHQREKQSVDSLEVFNKDLVIPTGVRLDRLKADKATEFASSAFKQYCRDTSIKLEFASPNTPQQIGANERAAMMIAGIVRCLFADSGLPKFLWGELILTAVYLNNQAPHGALANATLSKTFYGKDVHLGHLRAIGARASVHVETHTKKLGRRAWEGRLLVYSVDSKSFRVYNPAIRSVRENRNVVFIDTPSVMPEPDLVGGSDEGDVT